ncbi:MAG: RdgB/HAM1 family non-canonical purine NTP pyrophosphatase [Patescibacteria group bacterium]
MKTILIATANRGKAEEIRKIFEGTDYELKFLFDFPEETKNLELVENAKSFEGNALIKAIISGDFLDMITLADDSGLCIEALDGRPGVYSARYSGEWNDKANYVKVLDEMKDVPVEKRAAHYHCSVAVYNPETKFVDTVEGDWEGRIGFEPHGDKSFGYAPIFLAKEFNYEKTNAEFDHAELININHRGKAFRKAIEVLNKLF